MPHVQCRPPCHPFSLRLACHSHGASRVSHGCDTVGTASSYVISTSAAVSRERPTYGEERSVMALVSSTPSLQSSCQIFDDPRAPAVKFSPTLGPPSVKVCQSLSKSGPTRGPLEPSVKVRQIFADLGAPTPTLCMRLPWDRASDQLIVGRGLLRCG